METLRLWATRLRMLFRRNSDELDDELAFHLEREAEQNLAAGMTPTEARRQAMIAFGSVERTRQQWYAASPGHLLETFVEDVRYALRGFVRNRVFTLTVVVTLALGIGATTAVFSVVDRILFRSLPYAQADRLVSVGLSAPIEPQEFMLGGSYYEWRDHQSPFESLTSEIGLSPCDLTEDRPMRLNCAGVEASFLPTLGVAPLFGRNFTQDEDLPNAPAAGLISYQLWQSRFGGDHAILGKLLNIDGTTVHVIGVLPEDFEMPRLQQVDIMIAERLDVAAQRRADPGRPMWAFARLKRDVTLEQAREQLLPLFDYSLRLAPAPFRKEIHLRVRSLRDRQMQDVRSVAVILLGLVVGVLLIACANVTSLLLARGAVKQRELAVRSALGASAMRLMRQAITESLLLSLGSAIAGCLLAQGLLRIFVAAAPEGIPLLSKARIDLRIIVFTFVVSAVTSAVAGFVPALRRPHAEDLLGRTAVSGSHARLRQWLVVAQIATSLVLLAGATLLYRNFLNLEHQKFGMQTESVVTASVSLGQRAGTPEHAMAFFQQLERSLRYGPGVKSLAVSDTLPPGGYSHDQIYGSIAIEDRPQPASGTGGSVVWRWVTPEYFSTLNIPLVDGRGFTAEEQDSQGHFVVLSKRLAERMFPGQTAVGRSLRLAGWGRDNNPQYTVVGVAGDVKNGGLAGDDRPEYYRLRRNRPEDWTSASTVIAKTTLSPDSMKSWMRTQIAALDPAVPVTVETMTERVSKMADRPRFESLLVGFFAATGFVLAMVGLYGVIAFLVTQREREIGVRMALGAGRGSILRMIVTKSLRLVAYGTVVGLVAALAVSHLLKSLLYSIGPRDPFSYGIVILLLVVTGLVASLLPARSATRVDPATVLRSE